MRLVRQLSVVAVLGLLFLGTARANISIQLDVEHDRLVHYEPLMAFITIDNDSGSPLIFDAVEDGAELSLDVLHRNFESVRQRGKEPIIPLGTRVEDGERRRFLVPVSSHFSISEQDGYLLQANMKWRGFTFQSNRRHIDVVGGLPLTSTTRTLPDKPGVRRVYQLSYLAREQQEALFLSVMEEPSGTHYGTFCLGSLVRVFKPVVEVDAAGRVTVVHQVSQKTYARSLLESTEKGVRLVDQDYQQRSQESLPGLRRRATPEAQ